MTSLNNCLHGARHRDCLSCAPEIDLRIERLKGKIYSAAKERDRLKAQLKIATDALEKIHAPDYGGVQGMIIVDMGFKHFCQHTAKSSLAKIQEMGAIPNNLNSEKDCIDKKDSCT